MKRDYVKIGPLALQRFGWHCFVLAWQRGRRRPVAKLFFGWALRLGVWLGRDYEGDLELTAALPFAHLEIVVVSWEIPSQLRQWAALDPEEAA